MKIRFLILIELILSTELEAVQTRAEFFFVYIAEVKADPLRVPPYVYTYIRGTSRHPGNKVAADDKKLLRHQAGGYRAEPTLGKVSSAVPGIANAEWADGAEVLLGNEWPYIIKTIQFQVKNVIKLFFSRAI